MKMLLHATVQSFSTQRRKRETLGFQILRAIASLRTNIKNVEIWPLKKQI